MQIFHKLEDVPADFGPTLVSVGNFDGVHRAHAHVLGEIVSRARATGARLWQSRSSRIPRAFCGRKRG